jgi:hypothetical protein
MGRGVHQSIGFFFKRPLQISLSIHSLCLNIFFNDLLLLYKNNVILYKHAVNVLQRVYTFLNICIWACFMVHKQKELGQNVSATKHTSYKTTRLHYSMYRLQNVLTTLNSEQYFLLRKFAQLFVYWSIICSLTGRFSHYKDGMLKNGQYERESAAFWMFK